jgi:hypothetical protein
MRRQKSIRVFKSKLFARFVRKNSIRDSDLCDALDQLVAGSIDADLGSGLFKQRIARQGGGKSGGFRTIIVFRHRAVAFFVYGFAKSDTANVDSQNVQQLRKLARFLLKQTGSELDLAVSQGKLIEVHLWQRNNTVAGSPQPSTRRRKTSIPSAS